MMVCVFEVVECYNIVGVFEYLLWVEISDFVVYKWFYIEMLGMVL